MGKSCSRCGKRNRLEGSEHCRSCLCDIVEGRAKKRLAGIKPSKNIALVCRHKNSLSCVAASFIIQNALRPVKLRIIGRPDANRLAGSGITALTANCSDDVAADFLQSFIRSSVGRKEGNAANLLGLITEKELELYASIKKLKYAKAKKSTLKQRTQTFHARYPGTVEALARSGTKVSELMRR